MCQTPRGARTDQERALRQIVDWVGAASLSGAEVDEKELRQSLLWMTGQLDRRQSLLASMYQDAIACCTEKAMITSSFILEQTKVGVITASIKEFGAVKITKALRRQRWATVQTQLRQLLKERGKGAVLLVSEIAVLDFFPTQIEGQRTSKCPEDCKWVILLTWLGYVNEDGSVGTSEEQSTMGGHMIVVPEQVELLKQLGPVEWNHSRFRVAHNEERTEEADGVANETSPEGCLP